jgi:hypothetical protein
LRHSVIYFWIGPSSPSTLLLSCLSPMHS